MITNKRRARYAGLAIIVLLALLPAARLLAESGEDSGTVDERGVWTHDTPADIGVEVLEATKGFTYREPAALGLQRGTVTIPQAEGITWGFGDTPCGYGWDIILPAHTEICFNEDKGTVATRDFAEADRALTEQIIASAPKYQRLTEWPK